MPALISALLLALLAAPSLSRAAETPVDGAASMVGQGAVKPTRRDVIDLVSLAMSQGQDVNINGDMAQLLGLRRDLRTRLIHFPSRVTPDHLERAFEVVYKPDRHGKPQPIGVLMDVTKTSLRDSMKYIETCVLRLSLEGELQDAAFEEGRFKKIERRPMPRDQVLDLYRGELNFWQFDSLGLEADR